MADSLRARIDAAIRPIMLIGLQDAQLDGPGGTQRINEWADWISEQAAGVVEALQPAGSDRCPRCLCDDCGGPLDKHTETGCGCEECAAYPEYACGGFAVPELTLLMAQQLGLLLSAHLNEKARVRCLAVAHAAHHAMHDYDQRKETER